MPKKNPPQSIPETLPTMVHDYQPSLPAGRDSICKTHSAHSAIVPEYNPQILRMSPNSYAKQFVCKCLPRKNIALQDIRDVVEKKLQAMVSTNPLMMDYYKRYQEIIADYNREKDRTTIEQTFAELMALADSLDDEQRRAVEEGLSQEEMAIFDLLKSENLSKKDREIVKQASKSLLTRIRELLASMQLWTRNAQTQAEVETSILDWLFETLPHPPFTEEETNILADRIYEHVWQQSEAGNLAAEKSGR